jgi:hypothetical protein
MTLVFVGGVVYLNLFSTYSGIKLFRGKIRCA